MSPERKTFLVWWTALLLFFASAAYIKYNKGRGIHEPKDDVATVDATSTPPVEISEQSH